MLIRKFSDFLFLKEKNGKRIPEVVSIQSLKTLREKFSHFIKKAFIGFIRMWFEIG